MPTLRFGVIGTGYFGKHYVRLLNNFDGAELVATASREAETAAVIGDSRVDCIVIATPAATHYQIAADALAAGKHVLVEKPMVLQLSDANTLAKLVKRTARVLMVGHQYCYHDHVRTLKTELGRGALGRVRYLYAEHLYCGPMRRDVGAFWDSATHVLALVDYLFGPCQIVDAAGTALTMTGGPQDDFTAGTVTFADGLLLTMVLSRFAPQKVRRFTLGGADGMAVFDDAEPEAKLRLFRTPYPRRDASPSSSQFLASVAPQVVTPAVAPREPLRNQLEHFIDCVVNGQIPLTDVEHGNRITAALALIGQRFKVPAPAAQ